MLIHAQIVLDRGHEACADWRLQIILWPTSLFGTVTLRVLLLFACVWVTDVGHREDSKAVICWFFLYSISSSLRADRDLSLLGLT